MAKLLQAAISLATKAHEGHEDPPGLPYILHPMRVMLSLAREDDARLDEHLLCVAVLHDVAERAGVKARELEAAGMPRAVVRAVQLLTHDPDDAYADYVIRLARDGLARRVKLADLMDNADLRRVTFRAGKAKKDSRRVVRYAASYKFLTGQMTAREYKAAMARAEP